MKAEAMPLTFLGNEGAVKIPFFQRGYVWDKTNWSDLLEDLYDNTRNTFLGSLILKQVKQQTGKPKEVLIIDGQQRLTTLSILLRALLNSFSEEIKKNCKTSMETYLFYKRQQTDRHLNVKLCHSRIDSSYYNKVISNNLTELEIDSITSQSNRILQCYKYFLNELITMEQEKTTWLFNYLLDSTNKILVLIDLSEDDDEQAIFDTINSAGVRLSGADIIKNAIFQKALELMENEDDVVKLYQDHWENIFFIDDDARVFWETPRATGRLMRDNIEILLHSIAVIKYFFDPDKHTLSDLATLYKKYIHSLHERELESFLQDISKYASIYRDKILVFDRSTLFSFEDYSQRLFHILDVCGLSTFHPYILSLYFQYDDNETVLKSELLKLEKYVMKRMISKRETKSYNKTCKDLIDDKSIIESKINEIDNSEIKSSLKNITNKNAALILFWVELYRRHNDTMQSVKELKYNYSLEHMMPQKWEEHWLNVNVYNEGEIERNPEKSKAIRYQKIYSIGNMTLLNSRLNTALRNYSFVKKVSGEGRKKGIMHYSELCITKQDILIPFEQGNKSWDERNIDNRTNGLSDEILEIWS
jgi:uncharacterized protein with ParB-like and HNH nuclease domain